MKKIVIFLMFAVLVTACDMVYENESPNTSVKLKSVDIISADLISINPSGDLTGVEDADNIAFAFENINAGGTIELTAGHYYVSRNIYCEGFSGTLKGAGKDLTIIEAVRKGPGEGDGFEPLPSPFRENYTPYQGYTYPILIHLEYPEGNVNISDLSLIVNDPNPADPYLSPYLYIDPTEETTQMDALIAVFGGDHNTNINNIKVTGQLNDNNSNIVQGIWITLGDFDENDILIQGVGDLNVDRVEISKTDFGVYFLGFNSASIQITNNVINHCLFTGIDGSNFKNSSIVISNNHLEDIMGGIGIWEDIYELEESQESEESKIIIASNQLTNVQYGIERFGIGIEDDITMKIIKNQFANQNSAGIGILVSVFFLNMTSGLEIYENSFYECQGTGIALVGVSNTSIEGNIFTNHHYYSIYPGLICVAGWGGILDCNNNKITNNTFINVENPDNLTYGAITLYDAHSNTIERNDFKKSNLPGWEQGSCAILLVNSTNNSIFEMKFPPGIGPSLCEMVIDDTDNTSTPEYDGLNTIHNYQPCENLTVRDVKLNEKGVEPPGFFKRY